VKEWAYVTFFGFFGVSAAVVITVAILSRFLQMLLSFFALPVYLRNKK
jgi:predicted SPOUT superfamily RNA methylase MTH1